jgi:signal transduction histidine kinase
VTPGTAVDLEKAKRTLLEMVSHELRTPLISMTMVQDIIEMQMDHLEPDKLRDLLETLHHGSHRLRHLVEQIVYLVQFQSGTIRQEIIDKGSPAQVWALMTGSISLAREFVYRNRDGSIRQDDRERDGLVFCHLPALKHALAELIANALNFEPSGQDIMITRWVTDDGWTCIRIVDQGCGMSPEQITQAMRDFSQIDRASREQQGMGLGLPLARRIIEAHGGAIRLKSVVGKGTQVDVALPIYRQPEP